MKQKNGLPAGFPTNKIAYFVTSNVHKFQEARRVLAEYNIATALLRVEAVEIQDGSLENIAKYSVNAAMKKCGFPLFVEDAGLFVEALKGFPGPYSKYVLKTVGLKGVLKLMENIEHRNAYFKSVIVFSNPDEQPVCFIGKVRGKITLKERGTSGFGYDPIFEPEEGNGKTFAEMTITEKNNFSHRAESIKKFAEWLSSVNKRIF